MMPIWGIRAHDVGCLPPEELAEAVRLRGFSAVHLALPKALPGFRPVAGNLTQDIARSVGAGFARHGVAIAVLGCYINPVHPDPAALEAGLLRFEEMLRHARSFGCPVVATETGSLNPDCSFHPGTTDEKVFDRAVASFRRLARVAEAEGVTLAVEGVAHNHTISTHDKMERLIAEVASPRLGVLYDPANFLATDDEGRLEAAVDDALDRFGPRLVAVHAKDCRISGGTKVGDLPAGTGHVPYRRFFERLAQLPPVPILVEDVNSTTLGPALEYLKSVWAAL